METQASIQPGELCIFQSIYLFVQNDHHDHCVLHAVQNSHGLG